MKCSRCKKESIDNAYKTCLACRTYKKDCRNKIKRRYKQGQFSTVDGVTKQCSDCLLTKQLTEFYKHKRYKDGYRNQCISCHSVRWKNYYDSGYNTVLSEKGVNDTIYKLKQNQKTYLHIQLKKVNLSKSENTIKYLGCSIQTLKQWLEFQFVEGMTWENRGRWQCDHIIPVSQFNLHSNPEQRMAFHWTNIQPLWKQENLSKYNSFRPYEYFNSLITVCRFIRKHDLQQEYPLLQQTLNFVKSKFLWLFATLSNCSGKSLEPKLPFVRGNLYEEHG